MKKLFFTVLISSALLYGAFLYILPPVMSSAAFLDAVDDIIAEKTGIILTSENFDVKTYPSLLIDIGADKFNLAYNGKELLKVNNASLTFDLKRFKIKNAVFDYIYLNQKNFKNTAKTAAAKKNSYLKLKKIPELIVKRAEIQAAKGNDYTIDINIDNLRIRNKEGKIKITFQAEIMSNLLRKPLYIGRNGFLYSENESLSADNMEIVTGNAKLAVDGRIFDKNKKYDFSVKADDIPVSDIAAGLLYFQKLKDKSKKFIENFYDFSGVMDADLRVSNEGITGVCTAENLAGKTVLFNVPIFFKRAPFIFEGRTFYAAAYGTLGGEKVYTDFKTENAFTPDLETNGSVKAVLTNKAVSKYIPDAALEGKAEASVNYHIKNKKITVKYSLDIPEGSDAFYKNANLGLTDKTRSIDAETFKDGDILKLVKYNYSLFDDGIKTVIITGNGMFQKENGRMKPKFIEAGTLHDAPVSAAGNFYKFLEGGFFNGKLKYDFQKNKITGNFLIKNSKYRHYHINKAYISALENKITVNAEGVYKNSPFNADISALNDFNSRIKIYSLNLFLDELRVKAPPKERKTAHRLTAEEMRLAEQKIKAGTKNFDIDLYTLRLNRLLYRRAVLSDINLTGSIKNSIFNFKAPYIKFADGILSAEGLYNFENRTSEAVFKADNINSSIAADTLFNLPDQIEGTADAVIKVKTNDGINKREGRVIFDIKQGFLPQLGTAEFMIKKAKLFKKSFTLNDILNIDMQNKKEFSADITGSFDTHNEHIENIDVRSANKYLSLYAEGSYNARTQQADLNIFGKYDKDKISKIKIYFIPLSAVLKLVLRPENSAQKYMKELERVPFMPEAADGSLKSFRIKIKGNPIDSSVKTEFKSITGSAEC